MVMKFTNNATSTLASGINNSVTSLSVQAGAGALFPTLGAGDYFYCTLANAGGNIEIVKVTARTTDTFTIVRGQDGTTAQSWLAGDKVELRLVAASLNDFPKLDEANTFTQAPVFSSPLLTASGGTGTATPGATGQVLASNGTTWTSGGNKVKATVTQTFPYQFNITVPSAAKKIIITTSGMSVDTNGAGWSFRLISSSGVVSTGYNICSTTIGASSVSTQTSAGGWTVPYPQANIPYVGSLTIVIDDTISSTTRYCGTGTFNSIDNQAIYMTTGSGVLPVGTTLTGVIITTSLHTATGTFTCYYEY